MSSWTFISDTHLTQPKLPGGDVLIVAGDITFNGSEKQCTSALEWIGMQDYTVKLVTAGNHDWLAQTDPVKFKAIGEKFGVKCLLDESIYTHGMKVYMSPYSPRFLVWAFNGARSLSEAALYRKPLMRDIWAFIPDDVNILVTHGPPYDILDETKDGRHVGCQDLWARILDLKDLKVHAFGHIHWSAGEKFFNGVHYINASICDDLYSPSNKPIVIDL